MATGQRIQSLLLWKVITSGRVCYKTLSLLSDTWSSLRCQRYGLETTRILKTKLTKEVKIDCKTEESSKIALQFVEDCSQQGWATPTRQFFLKLDLTCVNKWDYDAQNVEFTIKFTPPEIKGFAWSCHLLNLNGKIRKLSLLKNASIVLIYIYIYIYMKIYINFVTKFTILLWS